MSVARVFVGLALLFLTAPLHAQTGPVDALCRDALKRWQAPGLAAVIVHNDRVVYLKGVGVKKLGQDDPIGPDTLFPLASCTKAFTSLTLATLVDDKRLSWDDPVRKLVPYFKLADPLADANVTLRDLLCHRTGLGPHELLWYGAPWSMEERIRKVGLLDLDSPFRTRFGYQTVLFGTAGVAAGNAARSTWQDAVTARVFQRLGMANSFAVAPSLSRYPDQASPHRRSSKGIVAVIPRYPLAEPDPAGSVHSTARDLGRFLRLQLSDGTFEGTRVVSSHNLQETHAPHMVVRREGFARIMNPDTLQISYGLGWINQDYRGKLLLLHGGAIDGFRTQITLVPQEGLGIALVNNLDKSFMNLALTQSILDLWWKLTPKDWNAYYLDLRDDEYAEESRRHEAFLSERNPQAKPTLPLTSFTGVFADPAYGTAEIVLEKGQLFCRWSTFRWPLAHYAKDAFYTSNDVIGDVTFHFHVSARGQVETLQWLGRTFRKKA